MLGILGGRRPLSPLVAALRKTGFASRDFSIVIGSLKLGLLPFAFSFIASVPSYPAFTDHAYLSAEIRSIFFSMQMQKKKRHFACSQMMSVFLPRKSAGSVKAALYYNILFHYETIQSHKQTATMRSIVTSRNVKNVRKRK